MDFWRKYNMLYNQINKQVEIIDDVEIYFDNRIGIVAPKEYNTKPVKSVVKDPVIIMGAKIQIQHS